MRPVDRPLIKLWLLVFAGATAFVALFATHAYVFTTATGGTMRWTPILLLAMSEWYTWAALTPVLIALIRRYAVERPTSAKSITIDVAAVVLFAGTHVLTLAVLRYFNVGGDNRGRSFVETLNRMLSGELHASLTTCIGIVAIVHAAEYYDRYRVRKIRTSQLEAALARAQLDALRTRINPHFLFNALNSISALIEDDPKAANQMVARLGDFLRLTLKNNGNQNSTLEHELQLLKSYLQIEQIRFGDRLKVAIDVEPETLKAFVPSLILQPIVENSFRHAFSKVDTGMLRIRARRLRQRLELTVQDNGPGMPATGGSTGLGLSNTRDRLETQFGRDQQFRWENAPNGGLVVTIQIPFQEGAGPWN